MANPRATRNNRRKAPQQIATPDKSWFSDWFKGGIRGANAPIGLGPRIEGADNALQEVNPIPEADGFAPGEFNRLSNPSMYGMDGRNTPRPVLKQTVAKPTAPSIYPTAAPQRSGLDEFYAANAAAPVAKQPTHQDRLAMLDPTIEGGDAYMRDY